MKCVVCGEGVDKGPVFRTNPKGEPGKFAHRECGGVPVDLFVADIVDTIHKDNTRFDAAHNSPPEAR